MAIDPDYRANQKDAQDSWSQHNSDYWRGYRERKPQYVQRNRELQRLRNAKRRPSSKPPITDASQMVAKMDASEMIAKMDALDSIYPLKPGTYLILPQPQRGQLIAKMDALAQEVLIIPKDYETWP
jgi:hypothetical protein